MGSLDVLCIVYCFRRGAILLFRHVSVLIRLRSGRDEHPVQRARALGLPTCSIDKPVGAERYRHIASSSGTTLPAMFPMSLCSRCDAALPPRSNALRRSISALVRCVQSVVMGRRQKPISIRSV